MPYIVDTLTIDVAVLPPVYQRRDRMGLGELRFMEGGTWRRHGMGMGSRCFGWRCGDWGTGFMDG